jgi:hypothetical protein
MGSFHETPFSAIQGLLVPDHTVGLIITQEGQKKDESRQKKRQGTSSPHMALTKQRGVQSHH